MSKLHSRKMNRPNKSVLLISLISAIAFTTFIDPINWPKQVALISFIPLLFWYREREIAYASKTNYLFLCSALLTLFVHLISKVELDRKLYGLWSRSNGLVTSLCLIAVAFVFSINIKKSSFLLSTLVTIEYFGVVTAAYGILQKLGLDPVSWSVTNQVFGSFGNANFASAIWALCAMSSISLLISYSTNLKQRFFHFLVTVLLCAVIVFTNSIQGLMAVGIFLTLFCLVLIKHRNRNLFIFTSLVLVLISFFVIPSFFGNGILGDRFAQYTLKLRSLYWLAGIKMGNSNPLLGVGVDSYGDFFREFRTTDTAKLTSIDLITNNAHNTFIQTYATLGIIGLSSLLILFGAALWISIKLILSISSTKEQEIVSIIFIVLWALASISIDNIAIAVWNWVFLGLVIGSSQASKTDNETTKGPSRKAERYSNSTQTIPAGKYVTFGLCGLLFAAAWTSSLSDRQLISIFGTPTYADNQQSLDKRSTDLLKVLRNPIVQESHFLYVARGLIAINRHAEAIATLESGIKRYRNDFQLLSLLAQEQTDFGSTDEAIRIRKVMLKLDPRHAPSWLSLAYLFAQSGDVNAAGRAYRNAQNYRFFLDERGLIALESLTTLISR